MTRRARRELPCLVQTTRSRAEFLEASRSFGAASVAAVRTRRRNGGGGDGPSEERTPSTKPRTTVGRVWPSDMMLSTSIGRLRSSGEATPLDPSVSSPRSAIYFRWSLFCLSLWAGGIVGISMPRRRRFLWKGSRCCFQVINYILIVLMCCHLHYLWFCLCVVISIMWGGFKISGLH